MKLPGGTDILRPRARKLDTTAVQALFVAWSLVATPSRAVAADAADLILTNARIVTEDARQPAAQALAIKGGRLVFVGQESGAKDYIGPATRIEDAGGRRVLPGLVDAHIHPTGIADVPICSLDSRPTPLKDLAPFIRGCISRFGIKPGDWVEVQDWDFSHGSDPSAEAPTLRAALDRASTDYPIVLYGNDAHHGAFNSLALARARNDKGVAVGFSKASLRTDFSSYRELIGVDAAGEPDGTVNEEARDAMGMPFILDSSLRELMKAPEKVSQRLNSAGITAVQDAYVVPAVMDYYNLLKATGKLSFRVNLIQFYEPEAFRTASGRIDYDAILTRAKAMRARYAGGDLIRSEAIKIFADGVLEGNPYAMPPTLPESPSLKPYLQPIFSKGPDGGLAVRGYVDTGSTICSDVRAHPDSYVDSKDVSVFMAAHGYHPGQCAISSGRFQHERQVIIDYAKAAHLAGFTLHLHAISDAAVRVAVDAIESARAADGNSGLPDTIAHLQVVAPEDVKRIGKDHLYLAYTYSWAATDPEYDMSVVPFLEKVEGSGYAALHKPEFYYEKQFYPARQTKSAGGVLVAGSDAPVETRDPQPFVNMQFALTRANPGQPPANPAERLTINEVVEAYTINGARAMGRAKDFGSLEVGKSGDFIVLNQDIFELARAGRAEDIGKTRVLETWLKGQRVYPP
jgi:predicted amidohydrolase YtcJ